MTRFDADTEAARIELVADTVAAHRDRDSQFCTLEAAADASDTPNPSRRGCSSPTAR